MTTEIDTVFFLDLEETIIHSFGDPVLCNVDKIKNFLEANKITEVSIFSYAIWSVEDKQHFAARIKPEIERALGVAVMSWPSVQDMIVADYNLTKLRFDKFNEVSEYIQLRGKKDGFINYVQSLYKFKRAVLIDDVVPNITVTHRTAEWSIELWNVNSL